MPLILQSLAPLASADIDAIRTLAHAPSLALRDETVYVYTVTRVRRPADERDLETWRKLTNRPR